MLFFVVGRIFATVGNSCRAQCALCTRYHVPLHSGYTTSYPHWAGRERSPLGQGEQLRTGVTICGGLRCYLMFAYLGGCLLVLLLCIAVSVRSFVCFSPYFCCNKWCSFVTKVEVSFTQLHSRKSTCKGLSSSNTSWEKLEVRACSSKEVYRY